jgi:hypothetical protein
MFDNLVDWLVQCAQARVLDDEECIAWIECKFVHAKLNKKTNSHIQIIVYGFIHTDSYIQNCQRGKNIKLSVCLCVCVSVCLCVCLCVNEIPMFDILCDMML